MAKNPVSKDPVALVFRDHDGHIKTIRDIYHFELYPDEFRSLIYFNNDQGKCTFKFIDNLKVFGIKVYNHGKRAPFPLKTMRLFYPNLRYNNYESRL